MSSSFKRKTSATNSSTENQDQSSLTTISGWKPWIHNNLGIVSSGNRELDEILAGGLPLGSTCLLTLDDFSNYSECLLNYSIAEGISHNHAILIIADNSLEFEKIVDNLPYNQSLKKDSASNVEINEEKKSDSGLKIAWQYEKYLQNDNKKNNKAPSSGNLPYCCSYDISRRLQPELIENSLQKAILDDVTSIEEKLSKVILMIKDFIAKETMKNPNSINRIVLPAFHDLFLFSEDFHPRNLCLFLIQLKRIIRDTRTLVYFTLNVNSLNQYQLTIFEQCLDIIFCVESFAGKSHSIPYEFREFLGYFVVRKLSQQGMLSTTLPKAMKMGIKRDRRKLYVEPLHLPPEESRSFPSAGGNPENALGCSSISQKRNNEYKNDLESVSNTDQAKNQSVNQSQNSSKLEISGTEKNKPDFSGVSLTQPERKQTLAEKLAEARLARQQGTPDSNSKSFTPISISNSKVAMSFKKKESESLDF